MTIEKIDPDFKLPFNEAAILSGDPQELNEYLLTLVKQLQDLVDRFAIVANFTVDLVDGAAVYYALKAEDQDYPDGTWRRLQVGGNLEDQVKLNGTFVTVFTRERPI